MRYVCLVHGDEAAMLALSSEEFDGCVRDSVAYDDSLARQGHLVVAHALESPARATSLVTRGGRVVTTDGPFSESKEQLLGFLLIEVKDREEAMALASRVPMLRYGRIEVRAIGKPDR